MIKVYTFTLVKLLQGRNGLSQPNNQNDWVTQYSVKYMVNPSTGDLEDYREADGSIKVSENFFINMLLLSIEIAC